MFQSVNRFEVYHGAGADIAEGVEVAVERAAGQLPVMLAVFHPSVLVAKPEDHLLDVGEELVSVIVRVFKLRVDPIAKGEVCVAVEFGSVVQVPHGGPELVILGKHEEAVEIAERGARFGRKLVTGLDVEILKAGWWCH